MTYYFQVRPDAPADGGEGFKRTWSEAKEEVRAIWNHAKADLLIDESQLFLPINRQDGQKMDKAMGNAQG